MFKTFYKIVRDDAGGIVRFEPFSDLRVTAEAFAGVWSAMVSDEGKKICSRRFTDEVLSLRPHGMSEAGWTAAVMFDSEYLSKYGANIIDLHPKESAQFIERAIRLEIVSVGDGDPYPYATQYERATARHSAPEGPWIGRRGARR